MEIGFESDRFSFQYKENKIEKALLWERHCHAHFEMISVLEGDVSISIEGREHRLRADRSVILPPLVYHTVTANRSGKYRRLTAWFEPSAIPAALADAFLGDGASAVIFHSPEAKELEEICRDSSPSFYAPLAESIMIRLFYEQIKSTSDNAKANIDENLKKILEYIDGNLNTKLTLDGIAKHVARSRSHVSHVFAEKMGTTPKQYILSKKLALAEKHLTSGTPASEVALLLGYENYSDFYRIYKKNKGHAPSSVAMNKKQ